jgi:hypothetical protein
MKSHFLLLFLFCTLSSTLCHAVSTGQVMGKVLNSSTNALVPDIEIVFENKLDKVVVTCGENGHFYIDHIPTGKYDVTVKFMNKTFVVTRVPVYDGYSTDLEVNVSEDSSLPEVIFTPYTQPLINTTAPNNVQLNNSSNRQSTRSLSEALEMQRGVDVRDGKLFVKGSSDVKFFIDGTPILGQPSLQRGW